MKILFCAYRDWALKAVDLVKNEFKNNAVQHEFRTITSPEEIDVARSNDWTMIILVGWSWKIPGDIVNKTLTMGIHPSDLPQYAGGSPIQHQIIDGLSSTYATLFRITEQLDQGEIIAKQTLDLRGHITDVFESLSNTAFSLIVGVINRHPNHIFVPQPFGGVVRRRLKPEQSKITREMLSSMTCKQLYDFIRCREDPYPNVFLEDETGRLFFKSVEFDLK